MTEERKYIYSIISAQGGSASGGKNPHETQVSAMLCLSEVITGINNRDIILISYKDIAAVVSNTHLINFDKFDKNGLTQLIATHNQVNADLMKKYDVVPMAFGTIAQNQAEVLGILEKAYLQFKTALKKISGKTEFVVQVFWDEKELLEELANNDPEIQKLKEEAQSPLKGIAAKLKLGKLIFETLENKRKEYLKDVEIFLKECCIDSHPGKLLDKAMIGNISFLIKEKAEPEFDKKMQELGEKYADSLRFKYIGPMPPYSFANINLGFGNFEIVNEARKLLELGEEATFDEIKKAYYGLSRRYHPDKHQDQNAHELMKKTNQAYNILENYCSNCDEFMRKVESQRYSFREEDVENSIAIK